MALVHDLNGKLDEAECKAWDSLGRYKFVMFGYWAGVWVHLNKLLEKPRHSPFGQLVQLARKMGKQFGMNLRDKEGTDG